ncbi:hypothetical protein [Bacillus cereus]|uniref:hypothetical protein n=1 Tax=Bacillus cereus TaxID=1396 RepID=UPI000BFC8FC6|nr:hypothetical protein [Bacillus cereus]PGY17742.1 hypothetical protein COE23_05620 [Bacillus cereus]
MVINPSEPYRHKDGTIVHVVEVNPNDWYCWAKYPDGDVKLVSEDIFFRDFEPLKKAASKS